MAKGHAVDVHVGARMRTRRNMIGMSQGQLGTAVGLTFQQIQKYERGSNRIGCSRLYEFAKVLGVPITYFFEELPTKAADQRLASIARGKPIVAVEIPALKDPLMRRRVAELAKDFAQIKDLKLQDSFALSVKAAAKATNRDYQGQRRKTGKREAPHAAKQRDMRRDRGRGRIRVRGSSGEDSLAHESRP